MTQYELKEYIYLLNNLEESLRISQEIEDTFTCCCSNKIAAEFDDLQDRLKEAYTTLRQILENKEIFIKDETALQKQHVDYFILMDCQKNK